MVAIAIFPCVSGVVFCVSVLSVRVVSMIGVSFWLYLSCGSWVEHVVIFGFCVFVMVVFPGAPTMPMGSPCFWFLSAVFDVFVGLVGCPVMRLTDVLFVIWCQVSPCL